MKKASKNHELKTKDKRISPEPVDKLSISPVPNSPLNSDEELKPISWLEEKRSHSGSDSDLEEIDWLKEEKNLLAQHSAKKMKGEAAFPKKESQSQFTQKS